MQSYYPWNTNVLAKWIKQELDHYEKQHLEAVLQIQKHVIRSWLSDPMPVITLDHIYSIAQYRGWKVNQVIDWLGLQPGHVQQLMRQNISETSSSNALR
ncbi:MAG: hypothetical protein EA368_07780 [Leptolyngbya sp. DLM2.Bin27]|nr:MAG: hypothetical protein EA368_07780 [Leptolyngbya sp. DLM2.Bin27]